MICFAANGEGIPSSRKLRPPVSHDEYHYAILQTEWNQILDRMTE